MFHGGSHSSDERPADAPVGMGEVSSLIVAELSAAWQGFESF
jgi:hypothetical protein